MHKHNINVFIHSDINLLQCFFHFLRGFNLIFCPYVCSTWECVQCGVHTSTNLCVGLFAQNSFRKCSFSKWDGDADDAAVVAAAAAETRAKVGNVCSLFMGYKF